MAEKRYAQLARELTEGIGSGRYPVGSLLPKELELTGLFGVSRQTVREALKELQDLGLVSRQKHVGTRVQARRPVEGYRQTLASMEDLVQLASTHRRTVKRIDDVVADASLARELDVPPGSSWLRISELRAEASGRIIGWTDVYVDSRYSDVRKSVRRSPDVLISSLVEKRYGRPIAEVVQTVTAMSMPPLIAETLDAPAYGPALRVIRRYVDPWGETVLVSRTVHPADRFEVTMRLRREPAAGAATPTG